MHDAGAGAAVSSAGALAMSQRRAASRSISSLAHPAASCRIHAAARSRLFPGRAQGHAPPSLQRLNSPPSSAQLRSAIFGKPARESASSPDAGCCERRRRRWRQRRRRRRKGRMAGNNKQGKRYSAPGCHEASELLQRRWNRACGGMHEATLARVHPSLPTGCVDDCAGGGPLPLAALPRGRSGACRRVAAAGALHAAHAGGWWGSAGCGRRPGTVAGWWGAPCLRALPVQGRGRLVL